MDTAFAATGYVGSDEHRLSEPIATLSEMKLTEPIAMPSSPLVLAELAASTRAAADAFIAAGTAANTVRSYQNAHSNSCEKSQHSTANCATF